MNAKIVILNDGGQKVRELEVELAQLGSQLDELRRQLPDGWSYKVPPGKKG